jgi:3-hydroxyisobutyrate dehydrogenase-like beta-hydroxyacid dehydrogenase
MKIAFLGLGKMGRAIAGRLLASGHAMTVWNRSPGPAEELVALGATQSTSPAEAVRDADILITMLFDDAAHEEVLFGGCEASGDKLAGSEVLAAMRPGALHISLATISVALSERLTTEHARRDQAFVAAPVFGRPNVAAEGRLWIVAAGEPSALANAQPLMETLSRGITVVGAEPPQAHAMKLGGNFLISAMIQALCDGSVYAASQGIDPATFLETANNALFQSPFYAAYSKVMLQPPPTPGATVALGAKDLRLLRESATARNKRLRLAESLAEVFDEAQAAGLAEQDWAAGMLRIAKTYAGTWASEHMPPLRL